MINTNDFIEGFPAVLNVNETQYPWDITNNLSAIIEQKIKNLDDSYTITGSIAVHTTAIIENGVTIKGSAIIGANSFIGANAYLREGVYIDASVKIGPGCEIKNSVICSGTAVAHFNYIGNSIIGKNVNFEAGSIAANHYNERENKNISVLLKGHIVDTKSTKFGALVGDGCRIGANAVLSPGTILESNTIVKRLELIEQVNEES